VTTTDRYVELLSRQRDQFRDGMFAAVRRLRWSRDRLAAERQDRLRALLAWSAKESPFHAERLAGVDVDSFTEADLPSLPIMTRSDLMANFDDVVTNPALTFAAVNEHVENLRADAYLLDQYRVVATSGTTGARGLYVYGWEEWTTFVLMATRWQGRDGNPAPPDAPVASLFASNTMHLSGALHAFLRDFPGSQAAPVTHLSIEVGLSDLVAELNAARPAVLQGYPTTLELLAREATAGRLDIGPRRVVTCGEQCTDEARAAVAAAWGVEIYDYWGCSEGAYALPCEAGAGMHLPDDLVIVEPVDEHGIAVAEGRPAAKILLTNLYNRTQPLIRYEITDAMTIDTATCACGCAHRRITDLRGRFDGFFTYDDGLVVQLLGIETILLSDPSVVGLQVTQTPRGLSVSIITNGACNTEHLRLRLVDLLAGTGLPDPQVTVREVDDLERLWSGKLLKFQPL
jgi:phenylacetate-coenzyme A ligase PaaK-like adenylate-forming protein